MKVKVSDIKVGKRVREDYGDVEELAVSIQRYGLFHPIVVDKDLNLLMGERRLRAHKLLGLKEIEVKFIEDADELTKKEMEIEENLKRKNFTWQEEVKAKLEVDRIKRKLYGSAVKGHGGGWGLKETARSLGESIGTVGQDVKLAKALEEHPELAKEKNKNAAWKKYLRIREEELTGALVKKTVKVSDVKIEEVLVCGDSSQKLKELESESVDLVLTDPPFAINLDKQTKFKDAWGKVYEDEKYGVLDTLEKVIKECYRVLKNDRHMYIFFGYQHFNKVKEMLEDVGFSVSPVPIFWNKGSGGSGGNPYSYANAIEIAFLCMKGRRELNKKGMSNVFTVDRVPPQKKIHPTQKPTSLLRRLIEQSTLPGELVIDPYAGSGSTLVAALEVGRKCWGCELDKDKYNAAAVYITDSLKGGK